MNTEQQAVAPQQIGTDVVVCGISFAPVEYRGARVMTLGTMDKVHQRPEGTARRNFNESRSRLIVDEDFYEVSQPDEIRTLGFIRPQGGTPAMVILLTETGYSMLVKSFTDNLAWEIQRQLVRCYFKPAGAAAPNFGDPIAMARAWADAKQAERDESARADLEAAKAAQLEYKVAEQAPAVAGFNRIANADGAMCITDAAKSLQLQPHKLRDALLEMKWMYRRQGKAGYVAYQDTIHSGYLKHKVGSYTDPETGENKTNPQVLVTSKGLAQLSKLIGPLVAAPAPPTRSQSRLN